MDSIWAYKDHGKSFQAVHCRDHPPGFRWVHERFGSNFRLTEIQSALGRIQLKRLPEWSNARKRNALIFAEALRDIEVVRVPLPLMDLIMLGISSTLLLNLIILRPVGVAIESCMRSHLSIYLLSLAVVVRFTWNAASLMPVSRLMYDYQ